MNKVLLKIIFLHKIFLFQIIPPFSNNYIRDVFNNDILTSLPKSIVSLNYKVNFFVLVSYTLIEQFINFIK